MASQINLRECYEPPMRVVSGLDLLFLPSSLTRFVNRRRNGGQRALADRYFVVEHILAAIGEVGRAVVYWELAKSLF